MKGKNSLLTAAMMGTLLVAAPVSAQQEPSQQQQQSQQEHSGQQQLPSSPGQQDDRARMGTSSQLTEDSKQEISGVLSDALTGVTSGDIEALVDTFSEADRERLGQIEQDQFASFNQKMEQFRNDWQQRYNSEFEDGLQNAQIPYEMKEGSTQERASIELVPTQTGVEPVTLQLKDEGVVKTTWRIDIQDSMNAQQLRSELDKVAQNLDVQSLPESQKEAHQVVALQLLKPLGTSSSSSQQGSMQSQSGQQQQQQSPQQ